MSGRWRGVCGSQSFGAEGEGAANDLIPDGEAAGLRDFVAHAMKAVEEQLTEIGEDGGLAAGNAVGGEKGKEPAKGVVHVGGGHEFAGDGSELGSDAASVKDEALAAGVIEAKSGVAVPARITAAATVAVGVTAAMLAYGQWSYVAGRTGVAFHLRTSGSEWCSG